MKDIPYGFARKPINNDFMMVILIMERVRKYNDAYTGFHACFSFKHVKVKHTDPLTRVNNIT